MLCWRGTQIWIAHTMENAMRTGDSLLDSSLSAVTAPTMGNNNNVMNLGTAPIMGNSSHIMNLGTAPTMGTAATSWTYLSLWNKNILWKIRWRQPTVSCCRWRPGWSLAYIPHTCSPLPSPYNLTNSLPFNTYGSSWFFEHDCLICFSIMNTIALTMFKTFSSPILSFLLYLFLYLFLYFSNLTGTWCWLEDISHDLTQISL